MTRGEEAWAGLFLADSVSLRDMQVLKHRLESLLLIVSQLEVDEVRVDNELVDGLVPLLVEENAGMLK